jgi:4-amino-4-deoxy-L-arabinose transferase-like glycosyltransferase
MTRASSTNRLSQLKIRPAYWLLFLTGLGFGLRVQGLDFQPLWGDEGWSFYLASQPLGQLLNLTALDIHPPLYYILLKSWLFLTGPGAEEARFLSVIAGTLLIPVVGLLGQRWFNGLAGIMGAAVTALAPLAIYYAQEVRMYGWVTLLGAMSVYFCLKNEALEQAQPARRPVQLAYLLSATAALYTHYYAIFILLFQGLYLLLVHRRAFFRHYFSLFLVSGMLYLPWVIYTGARLINYIENKRNVEGYLPLNPIRFVSDHLVTFSLGHLSAELQPYAGWSTLLFVLIAALGVLVMLLWRSSGSQTGVWEPEKTPKEKRKPFLLLYLYLAVPLFLGYLINQFYPFTPRFYERTLLLAAPAYWLLLGVGLTWLAMRQRLLAGAITLLMLLLLGVSLFSFYGINRYPDEDYRPLLRDIAARATPEDTLLASYQWQMGFYQAYLPSPRPHLFIAPGWGKDWAADAGGHSRLIEDLETIFARSPRLWFPAYQASGHIWEDEAEAAIAGLGYPALLQWYSPQTKLIVAGAAQTPFRQGEAANFDQRLSLLEATVGGESYQAGRDIIPVRLVWRKEENLGSEHWVSLRLVDEKGDTWASRDSYPQAGQRFFTDLEVGETIEDRHGLLTPAGAPPGHYRLLLSVRRVENAHPLDLRDEAGQPLGAELFLGDIELIPPEPPVGIAALPIQKEIKAVFNRQVHLVGYSLAEGPFKVGEALPLTLFWESLVDQPGAFTTWLALKDGAGETVAPYQQAPIWPASEWPKGTLLRDPYPLPLPPTLSPGRYQLVVTLLGEEGQPLTVGNADQVVLAEITTIDRPRVFEAPAPQFPFEAVFGEQARLVGLDLPQTAVKAGETLPLTLYWQALAPFDRSWKVFVHLTDEAGQIIGQQDQVPGGGEFPTNGWIPNEYLVDRYQLSVPAEARPGNYQLKIGLYDPNDFSRLPASQAGKAVGDHVSLESWLISIE